MTDVAILAALVCVYAMSARRLDRWSITPAIVFTAAGAILGPNMLDVLSTTPGAEPTKVVAEVTLAVILFSDATTVDPRAARSDAGLITRLLAVGLPLTIAAGAAVAAVVLGGVSWAEAALLGAILAPTDAALGLAVLANPAVPARVRRILNVESGLNDGIATPLVTVFVAAVASEAAVRGSGWGTEAVTDLVSGAAVGVGVGVAAGLLLLAARARGWTADAYAEIAILATALLSYATAVAAGGNGFVAAFVAGIAFRVATRGALRESVEFAERTGSVLAMVVWTIFGGAFAGAALTDGVEARPILYAVLSLTVVRMLPVAVCLVHTRLRRSTVLFVGWFGPRGLASVVFTLLLLLEVEAAGGEPPRDLILAATWTVLLSVVAHGLTAGTLGRRYGAAIARLGPGLRETEGPAPAVTRRGHLGDRPAEG